MTIVVSLILIFFHLILYVYFFYTVMAIFRGAAPIPSKRKNIDAMFELVEWKQGERLIDLGSGDGRILFAAAQRGLQCTGYEINPLLYWYSRLMSVLKGLRSHITVRRANLWEADLSQYDILTVYFVPVFMEKLEKKLLKEMRSGSRVVSAVYAFPNWKPVKQAEEVFLYVVP